ncbi:hypothetical protein D1AOALGA4SA_12321 [Olavius algarvensis Delta 1 endosymbiont]|nr:hypothetical protein D1AOALGA4SA_12321 [Olavius algarvensis Delta 1 endosymbiont]
MSKRKIRHQIQRPAQTAVLSIHRFLIWTERSETTLRHSIIDILRFCGLQVTSLA